MDADAASSLAAAGAAAASSSANDAMAPKPPSVVLEAAITRLHALATEAGTVSITETELLRRALNSACDDADAAAKLERERLERERLAREPSERLKEELKWALFHAAWQGDAKEVAAVLTRKGADPNVRQKFGVTPLHRAARLGNLHVCEALLKHGADPLALDDENQPASEYAVERGHHLVATLLKKWEADAQQQQQQQQQKGSAAAG